MATGDTNDITSRLQSYLPRGWFGDWSEAPIIGGVISGIASVFAVIYTLIMFLWAQTRLQTSTGGWIDIWASDFLGTSLPRKPNESDASYIARIQIAIFQQRATRPAMIRVLTQLTGRAPIIFEPARPLDSGTFSGAQAITMVGTPLIYRNDWQGNQLLYATPRTNQFLQSQNLAAAAWSRSNLASVVAATGPDGSSNAALLTTTTSGFGFVYQSIPLTLGSPVAVSVFAQAGTSNVFRIVSITQAGAAQFTLSGAGSVGPVSGVCSGATITALGGGWYLCSVVVTPTATGSNQITPADITAASAGSTMTFFGPQYGSAGSYIPTATAAATVTDYSITSSGLVTLAAAPVSAAVLTWTGSYTNASGSPLNFTAAQFGVGNGSSTVFSLGGFTQPNPAGFFGVARFGSIACPFGALITAYRPLVSGGSAGAAYTDAPAWSAFSTPLSHGYFGSLSEETTAATDAEIIAAIMATKPIATNIGVLITN